MMCMNTNSTCHGKGWLSPINAPFPTKLCPEGEKTVRQGAEWLCDNSYSFPFSTKEKGTTDFNFSKNPCY